jgi:PAS domain S-box-containing protein
MNQSVATAVPAPRRPGSRRIAWFGGLLIGVIATMSIYDIVRGYYQTIENTGRELDAQARVIAEQTARSFQAIDVQLRHLEQLSNQGILPAMSREDLRAYLKEQAIGLVQIDGLLLINADGTIKASSYIDPARESSVRLSGYPYNIARTTRQTGMFIGSAITSTVDGRWIFPMMRRLETSSGEFAGAVAARGRIDYFEQFYRDIRLDQGTKTTLMQLDGKLLARFPEAESALGTRFPLFDEMLASYNAGKPGPTRTISPVDGVERFGAMRLVHDYPLAVLVTRDTAVALKPWREQALRSVARTLALGALAILLLVLVMRQLSRLDAAQKSLEVSKERFAVAVAGSDDGIWDWDYASGQAFASARAREILGLPPGPEMQPADDWFAAVDHLIHPDDAPQRSEAIRAHLAGETPAYEGEFRVRNPDGSYRWIRIRGMCVRRGAEKPHRMAGSISDIDLGKRAAEALRQSEERFALAVAGSNDGILDWDIVNDRMFTSERAKHIVGIQAEGTLRKRAEWRALLQLHPDDVLRHDEDFRKHLQGESQVRDGEYRLRHADGEYRWVHVRGMSVRDTTGKPIRWAGSVSDIDARKRAEQALRESEERFALSVAGSNDGILYWDIVNDRMYTSERAMQIAGVQAQGTVRTRSEWTALLRIHPDDLQRRTEEFQRHLDGDSEMRDSEYRVRHPDGEYRWIRVRGMCVRDSAGRPLRWAGSVSDIDERKRAEEALRQSEERFALAVAGSNDGIVDWDVVNDRMFISERAMQMLGVASDVQAGFGDKPAMSGMRFCVNSAVTVRPRSEWMTLVQFHPDDAQSMTDSLRWIFEGQSDVRAGEHRVRHMDGAYRWVGIRGMLVRDASGKPVRWAGSISDIDARKRAEEALRQSEERFTLAVSGSNDGIVDWDVINDRMYSSERAMRIVGIQSNETVRSRAQWRDLITYHPDDVPRLQEDLRNFLEGKSELREGEYRVMLADGRYRWIRHRNKCVRDADGRPIRVAGSVSDIDAQKRVEGQLLQAKKLEAIGTLAGGIAHDFNNILAAILGYGEMAQKDAAPGTALRRHLDAVVSAGMRAKSLVERILAFSRSGVGERVPVHVQSVVVEALDLVAASLPSHVQLVRQLAAGDAAVMGDPTQIHQVVMNLCANGAQAMKSSGTLTVTLDVVEKSGSMAATSTLSSGRYVRLSVRDTGTGIAAQVLERVFDPFYTTKEVGVGTGLGLSLVHGIVTDLGGGIDVDSRMGEGTAFTVFLPLSDLVATQPGAEEATPVGAGETILLVDDEEALVQLGEEMIASLGYEPVGFTSSIAALESFSAEPRRFNAVLSDESMPDMTGSELAGKIHKIRPDIPIVLMSGFVSPALSARAREVGVLEVLSKPLVERDIARGLASALRHGGHQ